MRQPGHPRQCTARSKRSKARCLNYAMRGKKVCKFHGGKARSGYRGLLRNILNGPIVLRFTWFYVAPDGNIHVLIGRPGELVDERDWLRVLQEARRQCLLEMRAIGSRNESGSGSEPPEPARGEA